jgi:hypothetical protein
MFLRALRGFVLAGVVATQQLPLFSSGPLSAQRPEDVVPYDIKLSSYDIGMFTPVEDLNSLNEDVYTTLAHPAFPKHSVRIKKSSHFCDGDVK